MQTKQNRILLSSSLLFALSLAACGGGGGGGGGTNPKSTGGPIVSGLGQFYDIDNDGKPGQGDLLAVPFNRPVDAGTATIADFRMTVDGDSFGTGASVQPSPIPSVVTIELGNGAVLRTRGRFSKDATTPNQPSGVDVAADSSIQDADGRTAEPREGTDIAPMPSRPSALTSPNANGVAVADINWDGKPDLIATNANAVALSYGDGTTTMTPQGFLTESNIRGVVAGDLNRFSADELVTFTDTHTQVWNNQVSIAGQHKLTKGAKLQTGATVAVALADVTGNGKLDVLAANTAGLNVFHHRGSLGNQFDQPTFHNLAGIASIVPADFDGDGDIDLALGRNGASRLFRNDGTGVFTDVSALGVSGVFRMAQGDLDADGDVDLIAVRGTEATIALINDGRGNFTSSTVASPARRVAVTDLDRDGFADLVVVQSTSHQIWMNDRSGGFERFDTGLSLPGIEQVIAADIDRDGDADLAFANANGAVITAGSFAGTFGKSAYTETGKLGQQDSNAVALGDVDGDGDLDQVVANTGANEVWLNDGSGKFTFSNDPGHILGAGDSRAVVLGDLDNDGDLDAVIGNTDPNGAANEIYRNDGNGKFQIVAAFAPNSKTLSLALMFFNADQKLDIVVGNDGENQVFRNQSNTQIVVTEFTAPFVITVPNKRALETIALLVTDVDTDGDEDLIVVNHGTEISPQNTFVFRHAGEKLSIYREINMGRLACAATLGDFDGDGTQDLAVAIASTGGQGTVRIYRGLRTFISTLPTVRVDTQTKLDPRGIALRDLNGDGKADLLLANRNAPAELFFGNGAGNFSKVQAFGNAAVTSLATGDLDLDGDVDAVMTVDGNGPNLVYENK